MATKLLISSGILASAYALFYLYENKIKTQQKIMPCPLNLTRKILQQTKQQLLISIISALQPIRQERNKRNQQSNQSIVNQLKIQLAEIYKQKEKLILDKYSTPIKTFAVSLKEYAKDPQISQNLKEISKMMEDAANGNCPDLSVPHQVKRFNKDMIQEIYFSLCQDILHIVIKKLQEEKKKDPRFDSKDDFCFRKAIRELHIYDHKVSFLVKKGFDVSWGCPNQMFFKWSEKLKQTDAAFKQRMAVIEKGYQQIIEKASEDPFCVTQEDIADILTGPKKIKRANSSRQIYEEEKPRKKKSEAEIDETQLQMLMLKQLRQRSQGQIQASKSSTSIDQKKHQSEKDSKHLNDAQKQVENKKDIQKVENEEQNQGQKISDKLNNDAEKIDQKDQKDSELIQQQKNIEANQQKQGNVPKIEESDNVVKGNEEEDATEDKKKIENLEQNGNKGEIKQNNNEETNREIVQ